MNENKILPDGLQAPDNKSQVIWVKALSLAIGAVLSFGLAWQLMAQGFAAGHGLSFWIYPSVLAAIGITFLILLVVVTPARYLTWGANVAILIWYLIALPKDWFIAAGGVVFFALMLLFELRVKDDEKSRADFSISRLVRSTIPVMVYALLLAIGFNVYARARIEFQENPSGFYNQVGHYATRGLEYVPTGLGNFDPNQSFDEFVVEQAKRQNPEIESVPKPIQEQALDEVRRQLMERFNIQVDGNPLLGQIVAGAVSEKVEQSSSSYQKLFPVIFAVIVIALLRALSFVFIWLVQIIAWLIFRLLRIIGFFKIQKVQVEVNKLQI